MDILRELINCRIIVYYHYI